MWEAQSIVRFCRGLDTQQRKKSPVTSPQTWGQGLNISIMSPEPGICFPEQT